MQVAQPRVNCAFLSGFPLLDSFTEKVKSFPFLSSTWNLDPFPLLFLSLAFFSSSFTSSTSSTSSISFSSLQTLHEFMLPYLELNDITYSTPYPSPVSTWPMLQSRTPALCQSCWPELWFTSFRTNMVSFSLVQQKMTTTTTKHPAT